MQAMTSIQTTRANKKFSSIFPPDRIMAEFVTQYKGLSLQSNDTAFIVYKKDKGVSPPPKKPIKIDTIKRISLSVVFFFMKSPATAPNDELNNASKIYKKNIRTVKFPQSPCRT